MESHHCNRRGARSAENREDAMMNSLVEGYHTITDVNTFTVTVLAGLVLAACSLIKMSTDSLTLSTIFLPFLVLGGLLSRYYLDQSYLDPVGDKDANAVLFLAAGVLAGLIVMTAITKIIGLLSDWRWSNKHPGQPLARAE